MGHPVQPVLAEPTTQHSPINTPAPRTSGRDPEPKRVPLPRICSDVSLHHFIIHLQRPRRPTHIIHLRRRPHRLFIRYQTPIVDRATSTSQPKLAATADGNNTQASTHKTTAISIVTPPRCLLNANISSPPSSTPSASNSPLLCSSLNTPRKQRPRLRPLPPIITPPHPHRGRYHLPWLRIAAPRHMA